jgi:GntR family transcriptional repressor for pyruvate dehydrogenase complex
LTGNERPKVKASLNLAREMVQTIYDSGMKPGDRYLSEAEGLRRHKVGRGTYREALRFLELQGVIVMRSGPTGGAEIGQPDWHNLASTVALLMQFADAPLGAILEARIAIEPGMAELAAQRASDDEIEDMAAKLLAVEVEIGHFPKWSAAYNAYWRALAESSHNPLLASLSPALRTIVNSGGFVPNEPYRVEVLERLRRVHAAIAAHDPAAAREAMLELELEFQRRLTDGYPRQLERVVCWPEVSDDAVEEAP